MMKLTQGGRADRSKERRVSLTTSGILRDIGTGICHPCVCVGGGGERDRELGTSEDLAKTDVFVCVCVCGWMDGGSPGFGFLENARDKGGDLVSGAG